MPIVSNYTASGHSGKFNTTSGIYTLIGDVTTDKDDNILTITGTVTETESTKKVGSFSMYFNVSNGTTQDAIVAAIKAVRNAIDAELNPSE